MDNVILDLAKEFDLAGQFFTPAIDSDVPAVALTSPTKLWSIMVLTEGSPSGLTSPSKTQWQSHWVQRNRQRLQAFATRGIFVDIKLFSDLIDALGKVVGG